MPEEDIKNVLLTGFGPFKNHNVNASWVAVTTLASIGISRDDISLVTVEIPVEYAAVNDIIPSLWVKHKPHLVVHVGVSGMAAELTLEQQAHNDQYCKPDVAGCCPANNLCEDNLLDCVLVSEIDMFKVSEFINKDKGTAVTSMVSFDPGRYLCDFTYFKSLNIDKKRTAFIHVPPLNQPYTAHELALGLRKAIISMIDQLHS